MLKSLTVARSLGCLLVVAMFAAAACGSRAETPPETPADDVAAQAAESEMASADGTSEDSIALSVDAEEWYVPPETTTAPGTAEDETAAPSAGTAADFVPSKEAALVAVVALEAGWGDPFGVEMPSVQDLAGTQAWLEGDGAAAVGLVTETAQLWTSDPGCVEIAERLAQLGSPAEILAAASGTPDKPTAEVLTALHASVLAQLALCGDPNAASGVDHAWQWAVAYRRLS